MPFKLIRSRRFLLRVTPEIQILDMQEAPGYVLPTSLSILEV